ncbi:MAG: hypothetical protein J6F30_03390 [Cellulosilyticum sp.]|nr:hypothetical protein [Cellulosilyticum sp.]
MNKFKTIIYYPELREYAGSINAVIILSHLETCFRQQGKLFYKFMEPCAHRDYKEGTSWVEELQMTSTEFRTAFKHIGVVYKSKKEFNLSQDKFQGKMYLSYYDRISKLTYYMRNDDLVNGKLQGEFEQSSVMGENILEEKVKQEETVNANITQEAVYGAMGVRNGNTLDCISQESTDIETNDLKMRNQRIFEQGNIDYRDWFNEDEVDVSRDQVNGEDVNVSKIQVNKDWETRNQDLQDGIYNYNSIDIETNNRQNNNTDIKTSLSLDSRSQYNLSVNINSDANANAETDINQAENLCNEEDVPFETIKTLYNQICQSHQPVQEWSMLQQRKIKRLCVDYGQALEVFKTVFEKVEESDFLSGRVSSWKARLDWVLKPNHFSDILNDKYQNFRREKKARKGFCVDMLSHEWDFDEIEKLEQERIDGILRARGFEIGLC